MTVSDKVCVTLPTHKRRELLAQTCLFGWLGETLYSKLSFLMSCVSFGDLLGLPSTLVLFRQSKFRHVFGANEKREKCYDNIRVSHLESHLDQLRKLKRV